MEIGHIFYFGNFYSKKMFASGEGFHMGSYGIGVSRILETVLIKNNGL
jgi:prolyl-tRNA synthetase